MSFDLPQTAPGEVAAITINSPDLERSLKYYQRLGFSEVFRADFPFPWIQISDGALLIMLRKGDEPYIALTYYARDIDGAVAALRQKEITVTESPTPSPMVKRYLIQSPDGHTIALVSFIDGFRQPDGPTMIAMQPDDYMRPEKYANRTAGMFGEFAHPVTDLEASITFWQKLGLNVLSRFATPYPWAILSDGLAVVGLHQTTHFAQPVITYFARDMKEKIEDLKSSGLENFVETMGSANITLTTPELQKINLFSMGM